MEYLRKYTIREELIHFLKGFYPDKDLDKRWYSIKRLMKLF